MDKGKEKWIRFEDGLLKSEYIETKYAKKNRESYKKFYEDCCDGKLATERRVTLIFLRTDINKNKDPIKKALLDNIMNSCNVCKYDDRKLLTISAVRYEGSAIEDAFDEESSELSVEKADYAKIDDVKKAVEEGKCVCDSRKRPLWKKWILGSKYWYSVIQENSSRKLGKLSNHGSVSLKTWCGICFFLVSIVTVVRNILDPFKEFDMLFETIMGLISACGWIALNQEEKETEYFRSLDFPVIFFNEIGTAQGWMKSYIKSYMDGQRNAKPAFYIGMDALGVGIENVYEFIIPKKYPNWGWSCLCKLIRDLSDNPWGEIKFKMDVENSSNIHAQTLEERESRDKIKVFHMPEEEPALKDLIKRQKGEYWSYAKIHESIYERHESMNKLLPIGRSVYVFYKNEITSLDEFHRDIIEIQDKFLAGIVAFQVSEDIQYWLIVQNEVEQEIIEALDVIFNQSSWQSGHPLWETIWKYIVGLLIQIENQDNLTIMKKLCDEVWIQRAFQNQSSFDEFYLVEHEKIISNIRRRELYT